MTNETQPEVRETAEVLRDCRTRVLTAAPEIMTALILKATEGSYQHAKFLFDLLDAPAPQASGEEMVPGPSLAEILMERLQLVDMGEEDDAGRMPVEGHAQA